MDSFSRDVIHTNKMPQRTKKKKKKPTASPVAQLVKNPPTMQETQVPSLGQEDPLEKEMATHSRILAWEIPWMEKPGRLPSLAS